MHANEREKSDEIIFMDEVYHIIGCAINVSNVLGCGFLEAVYQEALEIEFVENKIPFQAQKKINIFYKDRCLSKEYIADFLCFDKIIIEIKAIKKITEIEEAQLLNYLKATKVPLGLLINFGGIKLEWKRYANTRQEFAVIRGLDGFDY
jgi:GxxExxY protein